MKIPRNMLSETAYDLIKNDIVTCAFDPGQFIAQAELAEKYAVGMTVREALRRLAQEGFVARFRMGYIVSQITPRDTCRAGTAGAGGRLAAPGGQPRAGKRTGPDRRNLPTTPTPSTAELHQLFEPQRQFSYFHRGFHGQPAPGLDGGQGDG